MAQNVVLDLARNIEGKHHMIVMNNFSYSVGLFKKIVMKEICALYYWFNRIGLSINLKNIKAFNRKLQGEID